MGVMLLLALALAGAQETTVTQQNSSGWCSPNIANVTGNVTVICNGVDPRGLNQLNKQLHQNKLEAGELVQKANEWAAKYHELEQRLVSSRNTSESSKQAEDYLHQGKLDEAGQILDQIIGEEEKDIDMTAANYFNRGLIFELQFNMVDALPCFEKAHRYRPDELKYAHEYAVTLTSENRPAEAEAIFSEDLKKLRLLAKNDPKVYQPFLASTLNDLGAIYLGSNRLQEAMKAFQDSLEVTRYLAGDNPGYRLNEAMTLSNLSALYLESDDPQTIAKALPTVQEALTIYQDLGHAGTTAYQPNVAMALNHLGLFYLRTHKLSDAESAFERAVEIYRGLVSSKLLVYLFPMAVTLDALGTVYDGDKKPTPAGNSYREALNIFRMLKDHNPHLYLPPLAGTLGNITVFYLEQGDISQAKKSAEETVEARRELWEANPIPSAGDELGQALNLEITVLTRNESTCTDIFPLAEEAKRVASTEGIREAAANTLESCAHPK
jgi:tetratricopeptide (TPR) repeat protein